MRRTIPLLRGLAILSVIFNHANWHALSQFEAGQLGGYPFIVLDQSGKFAIFAFMFISGYFIAYATSGGRRDLPWQVVRSRLTGLLWPWLIWSAVLMFGHFALGRPLSVTEYLRTAVVHYYFVPLLAFYYLMARWITGWAREHARALLIGTGMVQLLAIALFYARVYSAGFPGWLKPWVDVGPLQYLRFAFFFPLGVVCGMFSQEVRKVLGQFRGILPWLTVILFGLSVVETSLAYRAGGELWPTGGDQTKLSSALFALSLVLCFVVSDRRWGASTRFINKLGTYSYGLYLAHYPILGIWAKVIERFAPGIASRGWLYVPILMLLTIGLAVGLMEGASRLPTRRFYRYVFG